MILQPIANIAEICSRKNVTQIVLSPGSRCAHLSIAFIQHPHTETITISDERSAAFIALGMGQQFLSDTYQSKSIPLKVVALLCTSGTASLNYAPAIAEAFYQQIPLIIFTADRPVEWVDQQDGQTIRQRNIYQNHVKSSFEIPSDYSHPDSVWYIERTINEAINLAQTQPYGPVHINVPIREPFYPEKGEKMYFDKDVKIINAIKPVPTLSPESWADLMEIWEDSPKKLIVAGQYFQEPALIESLRLLQHDYKIPIVGDLIANIHHLEQAIQHHDIFLSANHQETFEELKPDLLITYGKSLISKNLKNFLRKSKPKFHWHIQCTSLAVADTFQSLTHHIATEPTYFFSQLFADLDFANLLDIEQDDDTGYYESWQTRNRLAKTYMSRFETKSNSLTDWEAFQKIMEQLPQNIVLHLANSMAVRYANIIGLESWHQDVQIFANRGTSGIDGSNSTITGAAIASPEKEFLLITGDLAFFYDRNAFWNNYLPKNLKIILLNNHTGNIFRIIPGSRDQPELEEYFETKQPLNAKFLAQETNMDYELVTDILKLEESIKAFFSKKDKPALLEIETNQLENAAVFETFLKGNKDY